MLKGSQIFTNPSEPPKEGGDAVRGREREGGGRLTCGKCIVDIVEGDGIDRVDVFCPLLLQAMTLEGVLLLLHLV